MTTANACSGRGQAPGADGVPAVTEARLHELAAEIAEETCAHLFVSVCDEGAPRMDWHEVLVPRSELAEGEEAVLCSLLHEWGHRTISPGSLEHFVALSVALSWHSGLSLAEAGDVVNLATDLWVEDAYLHNETWGDLYARNLRRHVQEARISSKGTPPESRAATLERMIQVILHVLAERASHAGHGQIVDPVNPVAARVLAYLFDGSETETERVVRLWEDVRDLLRSKWFESRLLQELGHRLSGTLAALLRAPGVLDRLDIPKLAGELCALGVDWGAVEPVFPKESVDARRRLVARVRRLELYPRLLKRLQLTLLGRRQPAPEGWTPWVVGDSSGKLDVAQTLQTAGTVISGVTTTKRAVGRSLRRNGRRAGAHMCLVFDDSGSTCGAVNACQVEAALGVVEAARHFRDPVSLVVFGSKVTCELRFSRDYENLAQTLALLSGDSGGTSLLPAVRRASQLVDRVPRRSSHVMILTDTGIFDLEEALPVLQRLTSTADLTFFCFESREYLSSFLESIKGLSRVTVYASPVGDGFEEAALREVIAWRDGS